MDREPIEHKDSHYTLEFQFPYSGNMMGDRRDHVYLCFLARAVDNKRFHTVSIGDHEIGDIPDNERRNAIKNALREKAMAYLDAPQ